MSQRRYRCWFLVTAALTLAVDQASKVLVRAALPLGAQVPIVPGVLYLTHTENPGAAFGLFPNATAFLTVTALLACAIFLWLGKRGFDHHRVAVAFGMMLGGALGNLTDRLRQGAVTDFVDLKVWPVFNFADVALTVGAALVLWWSWRNDAPSTDAVTLTQVGGNADAPTQADDR
ncbi:Lipoprotein signal peptidase [bacterium HR17]|uniref:Lipoprotein signal peptidase n=1 Tax=Candidatus Fervidibacter japonicus TaxID=2035412 RepID=A0A2H5XB20_9BACT|nr:Lipoprotein signal peptidase [bacterium HR17]